MNWKSLWESIAYLFEDVLLTPLDAIRTLELDNWWLANIMSWVFILITFAALVYWLRKLAEFDEPTDVTYFPEEKL